MKAGLLFVIVFVHLRKVPSVLSNVSFNHPGVNSPSLGAQGLVQLEGPLLAAGQFIHWINKRLICADDLRYY
jgi:hypothetical protein